MADDEDFGEGAEGVDRRRKRERPVRSITVKEGDAPTHLREKIVEAAQLALDEQLERGGADKFLAKSVAEMTKLALDKQLGGTWHAIVGCNFGGNITSDSRTLLNFKIDGVWFLVFRSGPPEKDKPKAHGA